VPVPVYWAIEPWLAWVASASSIVGWPLPLVLSNRSVVRLSWVTAVGPSLIAKIGSTSSFAAWVD
jgi:hypothetical protein